MKLGYNVDTAASEDCVSDDDNGEEDLYIYIERERERGPWAGVWDTAATKAEGQNFIGLSRLALWV